MFKNIFATNFDGSGRGEPLADFSHADNITQFLKSLSYWQELNLYITLLMSKSDISYAEAKGKALCNVTNEKKLHYLLEEAINSPGPKREPIQKTLNSELLPIKGPINKSVY